MLPLKKRVTSARPRAARVLTTTLAAALALSLAACAGQAEEAAPSPTTTTTSPTPTPTPEQTPEPEPTPETTPLTGGPVLAVKIDHVDAAYPRVGIGSADVIYVDEVEYGLTRLMAIFSTHLPETVGPIRSARPNDPTILANYGPVAMAFSGASRQTYDYLARGSQIDVETGRGFFRQSGRHAPHNLMGRPEQLLETGGGSQPPDDVGFRYGEPTVGGRAATSVSTRYPAVRMSATYDADSNSYRVSTNGKVEIDALTGDPVTPSTIVVQQVQMRDSANVTTGGVATPLADLVGSGDAVVLRDGQAWDGTWQRASDDAPTTFTVGDDVLAFAPGQIWIWLVPADQTVTVE